MPKKKFESAEEPFYDPFAAEQQRAAIRAAIAPPEPAPLAVLTPGGGGQVSRTHTPTPPPARAPRPERVVETAPPREKSSEPKVTSVRSVANPPAGGLRLEKTSSAADADRSGLRQSVQKRFLVTPDEENEFESFVLRMRQASASKIDFSVVSRVMWTVVQHAEAQILVELKKASIPPRPRKSDTLGLAEYEELWVQVLTQALRRMPPAK